MNEAFAFTSPKVPKYLCWVEYITAYCNHSPKGSLTQKLDQT